MESILIDEERGRGGDLQDVQEPRCGILSFIIFTRFALLL
jgi:hypothetical protein